MLLNALTIPVVITCQRPQVAFEYSLWCGFVVWRRVYSQFRTSREIYAVQSIKNDRDALPTVIMGTFAYHFLAAFYYDLVGDERLRLVVNLTLFIVDPNGQRLSFRHAQNDDEDKKNMKCR